MGRSGNNSAICGGGFHHVAVRAWDFEGALRFYIEGLGFRRVYGWGRDERATGGRDTRAVMLDTGDGNYFEVFAGGTPPSEGGLPEGALLHVALRTNDCDAALERARAAGAIVTMEPRTLSIEGDTPQQFRIAFCKGPCGETIEFFQNDTL
ncbi:lactoylglutathione lyase family protein [Chthonomonas calidirosea]|uniref:VOC family protein n=1 Tax=Chthonomonas calidirosea TaxID=454171 RepID=UPI0006DD3FED|nr:VOC family protein [Chthonomonas calidirosea]CEK17700.1 lactoylglutathione lyase family protein [Chthonomonas calidirosea]